MLATKHKVEGESRSVEFLCVIQVKRLVLLLMGDVKSWWHWVIPFNSPFSLTMIEIYNWTKCLCKLRQCAQDASNHLCIQKWMDRTLMGTMGPRESVSLPHLPDRKKTVWIPMGERQLLEVQPAWWMNLAHIAG